MTESERYASLPALRGINCDRNFIVRSPGYHLRHWMSHLFPAAQLFSF